MFNIKNKKMKTIENKKMSEKKKVMRDILVIEDKTIYNHAGLAIIEKYGNLYVSANEINKILKEYGCKLFELIVLNNCNIPLFKEGKMYDLLVDIYTLDISIVEIKSKK